MATAYSTLLGLALPVQGELSGTWGDTVDNGITRYVDIAVAGTVTLTNDGAVTLSLTNGDASATNIVSSLTGAGTVSAQFAIIKVTGTLTTAKILTPPSSSRTYVVVNAATGSTVTVKASGQTGVSIAVGETAFVYFNGTDYVKVAGTVNTGVTSFTAGTTGFTPSTATTGAVTLAGTLGTANGGTNLTSFTANGVMYASSSSVLATGSDFTWNGTNLGVGITSPTFISGGGVEIYNASNTRLKLTNSTTGTTNLDGMELQIGATDANIIVRENFPLLIYTNNAERMRILSGGNVGIGTSTPAYKLEVVSAASTPASASFRTSGFADDNVSTVYLQDDTANAIGVGGRIAFRGLNDVGAYTSFATIQGAKENGTTGNNAGAMIFKTQPNGGTLTEYMRLTSTGNLGLGVTPSAWVSTRRAFQTQGGSVFTGTDTTTIGLVQNGFNDGTANKYVNNGFASRYYQNSSQHIWDIAASGTAGNAISFTQAMTLDASGNLSVGSTGAGNKLTLSNAGANGVEVDVTIASGTESKLMSYNRSTNAYTPLRYDTSSHKFLISGGEQMRLDSTGLGIGTSSPATPLDVTKAGGANFVATFQNTTAATPYCVFIKDAASSTAGYPLLAVTNSAGTSTYLRVDSSTGNVGIGTSSPSTKLDVRSTSFTPTSTAGNVLIEDKTTWSQGLQFYLNNAGTYASSRPTGAIGAANSFQLWQTGGAIIVDDPTGANGLLATNTSASMYRVGNAVHSWYTNTSLTAGSAFTATLRAQISAAGGFSVGTASDPGAGAIYATGNITAYYSDARLKTVSGKIENALDKVGKLSGVYYTNNDTAKSFGYDSDEVQVGVIAQEVEAVLPQIVKAAPFDLDENNNSKSGENYKTVQYDKLVPLLIEAINELQAKVKALEAK